MGLYFFAQILKLAKECPVKLRRNSNYKRRINNSNNNNNNNNKTCASRSITDK